jgi:hypothetical protein
MVLALVERCAWSSGARCRTGPPEVELSAFGRNAFLSLVARVVPPNTCERSACTSVRPGLARSDRPGSGLGRRGRAGLGLGRACLTLRLRSRDAMGASPSTVCSAAGAASQDRRGAAPYGRCVRHE